MEFTPVRDGVWVTTVEPEGVTVGLVAGTDAAVLIDAGSSPRQGAELREAAARATDVPLTTVVLTHAHYDHSFGLAAFDDLETIGHERVAERVRDDQSRALAVGLGLDPDTLAVPNAPLSLLGAADLGGGVWLEIASFGPAHSDTDLVVVVPPREVIFAGDLVETSGPPQLDATTDVKNWPQVLSGVLAACRTDEALIVPGHGQPCGPTEVARQREGLAAFWGQSEWLVEQGVDLVDSFAYDGLQWPWDEQTARAFIARSYEQLAAAGSVPRRRLPLL